jgi:hypothetical protein
MSRTFLACFSPEDLLPRDPVLRKQYRYDMDYFDSLSIAAEAMRLRAWNLTHSKKRTDKHYKAIDDIAHGQIEERVGFKYVHIEEILAERGEYMQRLLPMGDISDMRLHCLHERGAFYTGVLQ